jgi:RNA polymerase sigma factor (TIGR02999 family)
MSKGQREGDEEITRLIGDLSGGSPEDREQLFNAIHDELHGLAVRELKAERPGHTLCPTALVNEAYMRLIQQRTAGVQDRTHFFCIAAKIMRRILVDHARARMSRKRGGDHERATRISTQFAEPSVHARFHQLDVLALEEALGELGRLSPPRAQVVEFRFFAGLSVEETARILEVHEITVKRHWKFAQAWLLARMTGSAHEN